jgi:hypothetical protein
MGTLALWPSMLLRWQTRKGRLELREALALASCYLGAKVANEPAGEGAST